MGKINNYFKLTKLNKRNIENFVSFFHEALREYFPEYSSNIIRYFTDENYSLKGVKEKVKEGRIIYVAERNNEIVGFFMGEEHIGGVAFANWIAVDDRFRNQGIGKALLKRWEDDAIKAGVHKLQLMTYKRDKKYYEKQGFNLLGLMPDGYFGVDCFIYYKTLRKSDEKNFLKDFLNN